MNNRASERALPPEAVRNAVNTIFVSPTQLVARQGMTRVLSALYPKGGFSCPLGSYFVEGHALKSFNSDNTSTVVYSGITGTEFAFWYFDSTVYFSDGVVCLKITESSVTQWGMSIPSTPIVSSITGTYAVGTYLVAYCWVDATGQESGCSSIVAIDIEDNSGFVFSALPALVANAVSLRIYMSTANGKVLYHVADTTASSYTLTTGRYDGGNVCESMFLHPPPPGRLIGLYKGRAYVADSSGAVWYSEPFSYDRFRLADSYIQFPEVADVMLPVTNGIFFAYGNRTDFYAGTPEDGFDITMKFEYGGVFGTGKVISNTDNVCWQSQRGAIIGTPDGQCKNIQEANVAVDSAVSGASVILEQNGSRQFVAVLNQPAMSKFAAQSWFDMEVIRRNA